MTGQALVPPRGPRAPLAWRAVAAQSTAVALVAALLALVVVTTLSNLQLRGIPTGFAFLGDRAGFKIVDTVIAFSPDDSYLRAIGVGVANTLFLSLLVCVAATVAGALLGVARLSSNPLVAALAAIWVEAVRNTPPVLLLIFLYALWSQAMPVDGAHEILPGVLASVRGVAVPKLHARLTPEFATVFFGLSVYTAGFIAEIVRSGIQAVPRGQWEAGRALGLSEGQILRRVVAPQTLRVITPPMTSQYINTIKNSTLAIAIGYSEFMTVMGTVINRTNQPLEGTLIIVAVYMAINLALAAGLDRLNRRVQPERG
jgi:general L-amino acid transport system permease protein